MNKYILYLLTFSILSVFLCSCEIELAEHYEISDYDAISEISTDTDVQLLVKDKKYHHKETDLIVLDVTNTSEIDCGVTIEMTYFDKNKNKLGTESKRFGAFSKGYQNYFCFDPGYIFDSYSYIIETTEYKGQHYEDSVKIEALELSEAKGTFNPDYPPYEYEGEDFIDFKKYPAIMFNYTYANSTKACLSVPVTFLLFNDSDELIACVNKTATIEPGWNLGDDYDAFILFLTANDNLTWPDKYKGGIRTIICVKDIKLAN